MFHKRDVWPVTVGDSSREKKRCPMCHPNVLSLGKGWGEGGGVLYLRSCYYFYLMIYVWVCKVRFEFCLCLFFVTGSQNPVFQYSVRPWFMSFSSLTKGWLWEQMEYIRWLFNLFFVDLWHCTCREDVLHLWQELLLASERWNIQYNLKPVQIYVCPTIHLY